MSPAWVFSSISGGPAQTVLEEQTTPDYRLNVVYLSDPDVTISSIVDALSPASVAEVLRDMPDLTTGEYSDLVTKTFGSTVDLSGLAELAIDTVNLAEHHIYGSSRLGVQRYADGQYRNTYGAGTPETTLNVPKPWYHYEYADLIEAGEKDFYASTADGDVSNFSMSRRLGKRYYELTDHLGNVMATALDRKTGYVPGMGSTSYSYYNPDLAQVSDYYPGGMLMPGRFKEYSWSRMGSQGQQKDDEVYGKGNMYAFKYRMNDTRINRFWSPDPLHGKYPHNSDYAFSENSYIMGIEMEGLELQNAYYQYANDGTRIKLIDPNDKMVADWVDLQIAALQHDDKALYDFLNSQGPILVKVGALPQKQGSYHMGHSNIIKTSIGARELTAEEAYTREKRSVSWDEFLEKDPTASAWISNYNRNPIFEKDGKVLSGDITIDRGTILNWNNDVVNGVIKEQTYPDGKILKHEAGHFLNAVIPGKRGSENAATKVENTFDNNPNTQTDVNNPPYEH